MKNGFKIEHGSIDVDDTMLLVDNYISENTVFIMAITRSLLYLKDKNSIGVWKIKQLKK